MDADVLIVGGGVAGLATAFFLTQRPGTRVLLLEREAQLGRHSSALNAAILRTLTGDPLLTALARRGARFLEAPPPGFAETPLVERCGLFLTADAGRASELAAWRERAEPGEVEVVSERELRERLPHYTGPAALALHLSREGRIDIAALMQGLERGARRGGARLETGAAVEALLREEGRVLGVRLAGGETLRAGRTVLAAGGWAGALGRAAGSHVRLRPTRRHLAVTAPDPSIDPRGPVVWSAGDDFYFRPESGGWMLCACDQDDVDPDQLRTDPDVLVAIARKTARHLAGFAGAQAAHFWCGMRTLTADGRFAIGPDPDLEGLFWVAGLGGHGMVAAAEVGRLAAAALLGGSARDAVGLEPGRLAQG